MMHSVATLTAEEKTSPPGEMQTVKTTDNRSLRRQREIEKHRSDGKKKTHKQAKLILLTKIN
jgi:hypothetical protein